MTHRTTSYLVPFDPNDTGEPFGLLRTSISGPAHWWLAQVWAADDGDDSVMVRLLDIDGPDGDLIDYAEHHRGCPWFAISSLREDIPGRACPTVRAQFDFPYGIRVAQEWQDLQEGPIDPADVLKAVDRALREAVDG